MLGGISTGQDLDGRDRDQADQLDPQRRATRSTSPASATEVETNGRHDPCVGIRATPIAEAMLALVVMDHALRHRAQCGDVLVATPPIPARGALSRHRRRRTSRRLLPFAAISLCYFGFIGLFSPYAPLWFQSLGYSTFAIGALTSMQSATRVLAPYAWGWSATTPAGASRSCASPSAARCSRRSASSCSATTPGSPPSASP